MRALAFDPPAVSRDLFDQVNSFAKGSGWLHAPMLAYAKYGVVLFAVLLLAGWWVARRQGNGMTAAVWTPIAVLVALGLNQFLVSGFHGVRPYAVYGNALILADRTADPSFPSDHATMAGAAAMGLLLVNRRLGVVAWAAALLMAFARVYVGAHFPHDVVAGLTFGGVVCLAGYFAVRLPLSLVLRRLEMTRLAPLMRSGHAPRVAETV
jgi:membrane-associated phospholipid phosphatase